MSRSHIFAVLSLVVLSACSAETLDGGSTNETKPSDIPDAPLSGTIAAQSFEPKTIEIYFAESNGKWMLSIDNYETDCGSIKDPRSSDESMTINVVGLEPSKTWSVDQPNRYATLQRGVYQAAEGKKPDARNVTSGAVVLDGWNETPGATVTGKLKLVADAESAVEGSFTARVCPAR